MKKTVFAMAAVAGVALAPAAQAQVCAGFPTRENQAEIHALANFPSNVDQFGVEGSFNFNGPLSANAGYIYSKEQGPGGDHLNTFRVGAAFDISSSVGAMLPGISVCPNVRADFSSQDGTDFIQIPIGLGLGASLPLGAQEVTLTPYVIPALVVSHFRVDNPISGGTASSTETDFGIRGGADVNFDRFFLGGTVEWINGGGDALFGVRAGIKF